MTVSSPGHIQPGDIKAFEWEPIGTHRGMYVYDRSYFKALAGTGLELVWVTSDQINVDGDGYTVWPAFGGIFGDDWIIRRGVRYVHALWQLLWCARREARSRRVVVHQQFVIYPLVEFVFMRVARALGLSRVLAPHDVIPFSSSVFTKWILPRLYRSYDALIVHSDAALAELGGMLGDGSPPIWKVPHGHLNAYRTDAAIPQEVARSTLGIPDESGVVLFLGQIKQDKGLDVLLKAMPLVLKRNPDTWLIIAGRPYRRDLGEYECLIDNLGIRPRVRLHWGYVPEEQLTTYYRASDVVALPYLRSYQSGVCFTAYAYRRPVVATSVGGLKEQVLDGETGYLVSPGRSDQLADALVRTLGDRAVAMQMGEKGHDWAEKIGDWDQIARSTLAIYQDCFYRSTPGGVKR
jgi:glycosyltransferase involved in cell wall biosynthesis